ncbi:MAG: 2-oxo acid dehydrogenase subunit E2 [Gammaproteobacteria bacterium]|nr:2-oxo acid dehydrogenase subunit E2 [Gammaproteobacteria bacterium]
MAIDYLMPKLAMAMNEGTVNEWLAAEGDYVEQGQLLATVETEKVSYDVESPDAGYLHIVVPAGETVDCDTLLAQFAADEDELQQLQNGAVSPALAAPDVGSVQSPAPKTAAMTVAPGQGRVKASPLARKMAAAAGLELALLVGTGPGGRIVKRDILAAQQSAATAPAAVGDQVLARLPLQGMRKTIATRMTQSLRETAQLSSSWESDIDDLMALRQSFVVREEQLGTRVSFNAFLIKAVVYAIRRVPIANSCLVDDEIVIYDNVNMGIAVSIPGSTAYDSGLMVVVLHNVDRMGVVEIDREMKALIDRVRSGNATAEDLSGSTFTLSSTAGIAPPGLKTTPVLNQPNTALLGPSTPVQRPVVKDGEVLVRTLLPLSFTFDHRILDGEPAARWMSALHECLENPGLMLA